MDRNNQSFTVSNPTALPSGVSQQELYIWCVNLLSTSCHRCALPKLLTTRSSLHWTLPDASDYSLPLIYSKYTPYLVAVMTLFFIFFSFKCEVLNCFLGNLSEFTIIGVVNVWLFPFKYHLCWTVAFKNTHRLGCGSEVEHLSNMHEVLGLIPSTKKMIARWKIDR